MERLLACGQLESATVFKAGDPNHCIECALAKLREAEQERDRLREALENFEPGAHDGMWGRILAWVVNGAPTREEGITAAQQINVWRAALAPAGQTMKE